MSTEKHIRQNPDAYLTIQQACAATGWSRSTIAGALRTGELPSYRIGRGRGYVRIHTSDLQAWNTPRPRQTPRDDKGFTLIELLVTVLVVGILAAVAIPVFNNQKVRAHDAVVAVDLRHVTSAVEAAFADGAGAVSRAGDAVTVAGGTSSSMIATSGYDWDVAGGSTGYCAVAWRIDGQSRYTASDPLVFDSVTGKTGPGLTCADVPDLPTGFVTSHTGGSGSGGGGGAATIVLDYDLAAPGCTSTTIVLPVGGTVDPTGSITWGDGATSPLTAHASHVYAATGTYQVAIEGTFTILSASDGSFAAAASEPCLTAVPSWAADAGTTSAAFAFYGATSLTHVAAPPTTVTDMNSMFAGASLFDQDISGWDVSRVTDMSWMFQGASAFDQDISDWDTAAVTNMSNMFSGAEAFSQALSTWSVGAVTNHWGFAQGAGAVVEPHWLS